MKITRENFKNIVRETMIEENEYQNFFKKALEKTGKSIPDMSDEEKKAFFNKIDSAWKGRGEKNEELVGNQKKLDIDGDGEIEASDLAALRAGKKKNERFGRGAGVGPTFGSADESVNEDFKAVVGKKVYSDGKGKLFFGYEKEDDSVHLVDYKTWKNLTAKNLSNEFMANRLINAIVKGQKQFNKKVDYNMWSNKTKPSFEQRMDYFMKNGWISNINKGGIKESVNEIQYKDAVAKFNDELIKHPMVKKAAQHYKKTPAEIVKVLQQRLSTKGNRGGDTKEVSIDFKDTNSGITVKHKKSFNESVNESSISIDKKVTNIINSRDFKKFVNYFNSFYGKKGVYSSGKDIAEKDIIKGLYNVFKKNNSYEWGDGDSVDREFVRDELFKMKVLSDKIYKNESVNEASIDIKVGDMVKVDNPHWEGALGKKGPFRRKVKAIYDDNVFFTDGSNSSMKYIKK